MTTRGAWGGTPKPYWVANDYVEDVSLGYTNNLKSNKFGRNTALALNTEEDIWDGGGKYSWPTSATITHVRSAVNSAATRGGTIEVQGLDANWELVIQDAALDAADSTTEVALTTPLIRCFRIKNTSATEFDQLVQAGPTGFATINAQISVGYDQTLMALYTIPLGYTGLLTSWRANILRKNAGSVDMGLWARSFGGVFRSQDTDGVVATGTSRFQVRYDPFPDYAEKTDLLVTGTSDTANADVGAGFDIRLIKN